MHLLPARLAISGTLLLLATTAAFADDSACGAGLGAVDAARRASVTILAPTPDGEEEAVGAGFLDSGTGRIVTNEHVIGDRDDVRMGTADGRVITGRVVGRDAVVDIALVEADIGGATGLAFSDAPARIGAAIYAVGSPFGLGFTVTRGIVSALDRAIDATTPFGMIQHDAPLNPGSSGGPVINECGRVIGINTAMPDGFRRDVGIGYAIPADIAARTVARLARGEATMARHLGVSVRALAPRLAEAIGVAPGSGVLVESVAANSPAWRAGLAASDVILAVGDVPIASLRDIAVALDRAKPDAGLPMTVLRENDRLTLMLPPASPAAPAAKAARTPADLTPVEAERLGITLSDGGAAKVMALAEHGPAASAGVVAGAVILAVGRTRVASAADARRLIGPAIQAPFALLLAGRDGSTRYVVVDPWASGLDADGLGGNMRNPKSATF
jgi:S1-C subfamily serine protease